MTMLRFRFFALLTLATFAHLFSPGRCNAEDGWTSWQFLTENDAFAAFSGSDEHYTTGLHFSWVRNRDAIPDWLEKKGENWCQGNRLCGPEDIGVTVDLGHSISETFYTPSELSIAELIVDDRPYAGYLHFGTKVTLQTAPVIRSKPRPTENSLELQLGFIGPETGAEWIQTESHRIIGDEPPLGWDNQLGLEPTVQLIYRWRRMFGDERFDIVPEWGAGLGNVAIYANAGATVRFGRNISSFTVPILVPTIIAVDSDRPNWEYYGFLGFDGRGVAHNIFLDGNTFRDSHSIEKENWVLDLKAGFVVRYKKCRLTYTFVRRSREFDAILDDDGGRHDFGSIAFTYLIR